MFTGYTLDLAVRGKLVPQDSNDESASVLLERIIEEKGQLIQEGKLKKQKPQPEISEDEEPFPLPKGWEWTRLGAVAVAYTGYAFKSTEYATKGTFVLRVTNINPNGSINHLDQKFIDSDRAESEYSKFKLHEDDVLLVMVGGSLGKVGIVDKLCLPAVLNQNMWKLTRFGGIALNYFVMGLKFINSNQIKITPSTHGHLAQGEYMSKLFPLPPLSEQHRIVAKVDELMTLCDKLEQEQADNSETHLLLVKTLLDTLTRATDHEGFKESWQRIEDNFDFLFTTSESIDELKQTILQLAVMGKLVPQDTNDEPAPLLLERIAEQKAQLVELGEIRKQKSLPAIGEGEKPFILPKGWEWTRLQDIICISSGNGLTSADMNKEGEVPVFGGNGITGYHDKANVERSTLVIGRVGYYCGSIHLTPPSAWITDNAFITRFSEENIYMQFLYWLLKVTNLKENEGATAQPVISGRKIYPIVVALPPRGEQIRIVDKVDELMAFCDTLVDRLNVVQTTQVQLADSILNQVSG